jgi:hypothetical protein
MDSVSRARRRLAQQEGMVTVEAAIALASLTVVLLLSVGAVLAAAVQVQCIDAAREAARLTARGAGDRAVSAAEQVAPEGAQVQVRSSGDTVVVTVRATSRLLPGLDLRGEAVAVLEPDVASAQ